MVTVQKNYRYRIDNGRGEYVYTHLGLEDAEEELRKMEDFRKAQEAIETKEEKPITQKAFKVV